jgi:hypothetical protein
MEIAGAALVFAVLLGGAAAIVAAFAAGLYIGRRPPRSGLPFDARCFK